MSETNWTHAETCTVFSGGRCNCRGYGVSLAVANESPPPLAAELTRLRAEVARLVEWNEYYRGVLRKIRTAAFAGHLSAPNDAELEKARESLAALFPPPAMDTQEPGTQKLYSGVDFWKDDQPPAATDTQGVEG